MSLLDDIELVGFKQIAYDDTYSVDGFTSSATVFSRSTHAKGNTNIEVIDITNDNDDDDDDDELSEIINRINIQVYAFVHGGLASEIYQVLISADRQKIGIVSAPVIALTSIDDNIITQARTVLKSLHSIGIIHRAPMLTAFGLNNAGNVIIINFQSAYFSTDKKKRRDDFLIFDDYIKDTYASLQLPREIFPYGFLSVPYEEKCHVPEFSDSSRVGVIEGHLCIGQWQYGDLIQDGEYTGEKVYRVCAPNDACEYIAKVIPILNKDVNEIMDEINIQQIAFEHDLAPEILQVVVDTDKVGFIMSALTVTAKDRILELLTAGDNAGVIRVINTIFTVIDKLNRCGITHGDAHLDNFMYDRNGQLKVIDFGRSSLDQVSIDIIQLCGSIVENIGRVGALFEIQKEIIPILKTQLKKVPKKLLKTYGRTLHGLV